MIIKWNFKYIVKVKIYDFFYVFLKRGKIKEKEKFKDEVIYGFDEL